MHAALQQQVFARRAEHIDALLRAYPAGRPVNPDRSVVDLPFTLTNGRTSALRISLPPLFPQDRPVLCVLVPIQHPAVDPAGRVRTRGLDSWSVARPETSDLVTVVHEAFTVLLGAQAAAGLRSSGSGDAAPGNAFAFPVPYGPDAGRTGAAGSGSSTGSLMPGVGGSGGGGGPGSGGDSAVQRQSAEEFLESLTTGALETMLTDESELRRVAAKWLQGTPAAKALSDIRAQNVALAEASMATQRAIEEAKTHVAIVRGGEYAAMRNQFDELYGRQQALVDKVGPEIIMRRFKEELQQSEDRADELLEQFQAGGVPLEAFVEQYVAARDNYHTVDLKRQAIEHHIMWRHGVQG